MDISRKAFQPLICLSPFFCTACDNENPVENEEEKLSHEIIHDLKKRFEDTKIVSVRNLESNWLQGTEVNLLNKKEDKLYLFYQKNKPVLILTEYTKYENLPSQIKLYFSDSSFGKLRRDHIDKIVSEEYTLLPHKTFEFRFTQFIPDVGNLYTVLTFNEDGYIIPMRHHESINARFRRLPSMDEINYIKAHYGIDIRHYDTWGSEIFIYHVLQDNILKKVEFKDGKWEKTSYPIPLDSEIPSIILDQLYIEEPNFEYTLLHRIETANGNGYEFLNKEGNGYIIMANNTAVS